MVKIKSLHKVWISELTKVVCKLELRIFEHLFLVLLKCNPLYGHSYSPRVWRWRIVCVPPDRPNIFYEVNWLCRPDSHPARQDGRHSSNHRVLTSLHTFCTAYYPPGAAELSENRLFHSCTPQHNKDVILQSIVFTSVALGNNLQNVNTIIRLLPRE